MPNRPWCAIGPVASKAIPGTEGLVCIHVLFRIETSDRPWCTVAKSGATPLIAVTLRPSPHVVCTPLMVVGVVESRSPKYRTCGRLLVLRSALGYRERGAAVNVERSRRIRGGAVAVSVVRLSSLGAAARDQPADVVRLAEPIPLPTARSICCCGWFRQPRWQCGADAVCDVELLVLAYHPPHRRLAEPPAQLRPSSLSPRLIAGLSPGLPSSPRVRYSLRMAPACP